MKTENQWMKTENQWMIAKNQWVMKPKTQWMQALGKNEWKLRTNALTNDSNKKKQEMQARKGRMIGKSKLINEL